MLSLDPAKLMLEIRAAQKGMETVLKKRTEMIRRFAGNNYKAAADEGGLNPTPENYPFSYKAFLEPQLLFGVPHFRVNPVDTDALAPTAQALEQMVNDWMKSPGMKDTLELVVDDCFWGFAVTKQGVSQRGYYGSLGIEGDFSKTPNYPFLVRVDPRTYFQDDLDDIARIKGHSFERDLEDVQNDERYPEEVRVKLSVTKQEDAKVSNEAFAREKMGDPDRQRVTLYEIYLPEYRMIMTLADTGAAGGPSVLRQETFHGPANGPFIVWGMYRVADEWIPISPLQALWDEFLELQLHSQSAAESATTHKRIGVAGAGAKTDAETIKNAPNGSMVLVTDPAAVKELQIGGTTDSQYTFIEFARQRLDRNLGFTDTQRGQTSSGITATDASISAGNSDLRVDKIRDRVRDRIGEVGRKAAWYFYSDPSIGQSRGAISDPTTGQTIPGIFQAGPWDGGFIQGQYVPPEPMSQFEDFHFEVDARSIVKTDDALEQKRAQDELQLTMQLQGMGYQVNMPRVLDRYGDAMNASNLSKIILIQAPMTNFNPMYPPAIGGGGQPLNPMFQAKPPMPGMMQGQMAQSQVSPGQPPMSGLSRGPIPPGVAGPSSMGGLRANARAGVSAR